jgi:hypothetical protein
METSKQWKHQTTNVGLDYLEHSPLQASCSHPTNPSFFIQLQNLKTCKP